MLPLTIVLVCVCCVDCKIDIEQNAYMSIRFHIITCLFLPFSCFYDLWGYILLVSEMVMLSCPHLPGPSGVCVSQSSILVLLGYRCWVRQVQCCWFSMSFNHLVLVASSRSLLPSLSLSPFAALCNMSIVSLLEKVSDRWKLGEYNNRIVGSCSGSWLPFIFGFIA